MAVIHVPRPPKQAMNPQRPVSALLKTQIEHLQQAELRLPVKYQTSIYVNAIRTEREASEYISAVTEAIHRAHAEAATKRRKMPPKRKRVLEIAAAAERKRPRKRKSISKKKRVAKKKGHSKQKSRGKK